MLFRSCPPRRITHRVDVWQRLAGEAHQARFRDSPSRPLDSSQAGDEGWQEISSSVGGLSIDAEEPGITIPVHIAEQGTPDADLPAPADDGCRAVRTTEIAWPVPRGSVRPKECLIPTISGCKGIIAGREKLS